MFKKIIRAILLLAATPFIMFIAFVGWAFDDDVPVLPVWWAGITLKEMKWD